MHLLHWNHSNPSRTWQWNGAGVTILAGRPAGKISLCQELATSLVLCTLGSGILNKVLFCLSSNILQSNITTLMLIKIARQCNDALHSVAIAILQQRCFLSVIGVAKRGKLFLKKINKKLIKTCQWASYMWTTGKPIDLVTYYKVIWQLVPFLHQPHKWSWWSSATGTLLAVKGEVRKGVPIFFAFYFIAKIDHGFWKLCFNTW